MCPSRCALPSLKANIATEVDVLSDIGSTLIVAVGCSADDIAAPAELLSALPADCSLAFIFVEQRSMPRAFRSQNKAKAPRGAFEPILMRRAPATASSLAE